MEYSYRVSKKVTFRMLLEPRYTRSITSSLRPSHPDLDELVSANYFFWSLLTKQDQALQSHVHWTIWPCSTQFWLGFSGFSSILKITFIWDTLYIGYCNIQVVLHKSGLPGVVTMDAYEDPFVPGIGAQN